MNQLSRGKAAGLNSGIEVAQGEIVVFTDARQRIEAGALRLLMQNFADPEVGCVSGELMLGDGTGESGQGMGLYWRVEKKVREMESASDSVVGATGALYAVRRELLTEIPKAPFSTTYICRCRWRGREDGWCSMRARGHGTIRTLAESGNLRAKYEPSAETINFSNWRRGC
jgi:cellulose synthase/poly-beta-1,6-N-acetylglucosamine synthase-like glycosyltransferase